MRAGFAAGLALLWFAGHAGGQEGRWITFKTAHNSWGGIEHQLDVQSIRPEGSYRFFWTRVWITNRRQPLMYGLHEAVFAVSQKFAVDCVHRRFGDRFIDSDNPAEAKHRTSLAAMHWESLDKFPAMARAVCAKAR